MDIDKTNPRLGGKGVINAIPLMHIDIHVCDVAVEVTEKVAEREGTIIVQAVESSLVSGGMVKTCNGHEDTLPLALNDLAGRGHDSTHHVSSGLFNVLSRERWAMIESAFVGRTSRANMGDVLSGVKELKVGI